MEDFVDEIKFYCVRLLYWQVCLSLLSWPKKETRLDLHLSVLHSLLSTLHVQSIRHTKTMKTYMVPNLSKSSGSTDKINKETTNLKIR